MTPGGFGARLAAFTCITLSAAIAAVMALGFLVLEDDDPFSAVIGGLYVAAVLFLPTLAVSIVIGLVGWAWARRRDHHERTRS